MIATIGPLVQGSKARGLAALVIYVVASTVSAATFGAGLAVVGGFLGHVAPTSLGGDVFMVMVAASAVLAGLSDLGLVQLPLPRTTRSVPQRWWSQLGWFRSSLAYGAVLGVGVSTVIPYASFYVILVGCVSLGNALGGALIMGTYGFSRALPVGVTATAFTGSAGIDRWLDRLLHTRDAIARPVGFISVAVAAVLILEVLR